MLTGRAAAAAAAAAAAVLVLSAAPAALAVARVGGHRERVAAAGAPGRARSGRAEATQLVRDLQAAWQITRGSGVTLAVVGQRVDPATGGLTGKVTTGPAFGGSRHAKSPDDTLLASAVAGDGPSLGNPSGIAGLAPDAKVLSLQVPLNDTASGWQRDDARAIRYAVKHRAGVVFVDLTGVEDASALDSAVRYALSRNVIVVADEWGGPQRKTLTYPPGVPGVLAAGAVTLHGLPQPCGRAPVPAAANDSVLISAPGNNLYETGPGGPGYAICNDLSASAWLTGTAVLIKAMFPHLPPSLAGRAIALSARDRPPHGYSTSAGFGMINPVGALRAAGRLAKLPAAAHPGGGAAAPSSRLATGPAPGVISAVRHSTVKLAACGAAIAAGAVLLVLAGLLTRRRRPAAGPPQQPPSAYPPQSPPSGYPPPARPTGYPPQSPPSGYPPRARPTGYPPQSPPSGYPPRARPSGYPPPSPGVPPQA